MSFGLASLVNNYDDMFEFAKAMYKILLACFPWTPRVVNSWKWMCKVQWLNGVQLTWNQQLIIHKFLAYNNKVFFCQRTLCKPSTIKLTGFWFRNAKFTMLNRNPSNLRIQIYLHAGRSSVASSTGRLCTVKVDKLTRLKCVSNRDIHNSVGRNTMYVLLCVLSSSVFTCSASSPHCIKFFLPFLPNPTRLSPLSVPPIFSFWCPW